MPIKLALKLGQPNWGNRVGATVLDDEHDEHDEHDTDLTGDAAAIGWRSVNVKTKGMARAMGNKRNIIPVVLRHILRQGDATYRARHPHDRARTHFNSVLTGDGMADDLAAAAHALLDGVGRQQANNTMTLTVVCKLPAALDAEENWRKVLEWVRENRTTAGLPIVNATVHRDQSACGAHLHVVLLPVRDGRRVDKPEPAVFRGSFGEFVRRAFNVRVDDPEERRKARQERKASSLGELAASPGKGAKTTAGADARDAKMMARIDPETGELLPVEGNRTGEPGTVAGLAGAQKHMAEPTGESLKNEAERLPQSGHTCSAFPSAAPPADILADLTRAQKHIADQAAELDHLRAILAGRDDELDRLRNAVSVAEAGAAVARILVEPSPALLALRKSREVPDPDPVAPPAAPAPSASPNHAKRKTPAKPVSPLMAQWAKELTGFLAGHGWFAHSSVLRLKQPGWNGEAKAKKVLEWMAENGLAEAKRDLSGFDTKPVRRYRIHATKGAA